MDSQRLIPQTGHVNCQPTEIRAPRNQVIITINVPLFKKLRDIIFAYDNVRTRHCFEELHVFVLCSTLLRFFYLSVVDILR
jgi:hypothetical protein